MPPTGCPRHDIGQFMAGAGLGTCRWCNQIEAGGLIMQGLSR